MGSGGDELFIGTGSEISSTEVRENILFLQNKSNNPVLLIKSDDAFARFNEIRKLNSIYEKTEGSALIRHISYFSYHITKFFPRQLWINKPISPGFEPHKMLGITGYTIAYGYIGEAYIVDGYRGVFIFGIFYCLLLIPIFLYPSFTLIYFSIVILSIRSLNIFSSFLFIVPFYLIAFYLCKYFSNENNNRTDT
jgi:hypothetical protein